MGKIMIVKIDQKEWYIFVKSADGGEGWSGSIAPLVWGRGIEMSGTTAEI